MEQEAPAPKRALDLLRPLRYAWRVPLLMLHMVVSLPICLLVNIAGKNIRLRSGESLEHRVIRWWSYVLMRVFGFRVINKGEPWPGPMLLVANHITWMDIEIIHSVRMAAFVAKKEISRWPLVGWLATRAGTIFHERGNQESLAQVGQIMVERLKAGWTVAVFPEGGTGPGDQVKTFHGRIFQAAIDAQVPAQPVALRFSRRGRLITDVAFRKKESFLGNFLRTLGAPGTQAEVIFLEPIGDGEQGRRRMAETARGRIVAALGLHEEK